MASANDGVVWDLGDLTPSDSPAPADPQNNEPIEGAGRFRPLAAFVGLMALVAVVAMLLPTEKSPPAPVVLPEEEVAAVVVEPTATPVSSERMAAEEFLRGNVGIGTTLCNAMAKYFDETPFQVERARRYAECLDDFEIPFRLPTSQIHQAYGIPIDTEPAILIRCGEVLSGPDVSQAAFAEFEACAVEAEEVFGLA